MKYSQRDLRAVEILALVLVGLGTLCLLLAFVVWTQLGQGSEVAPKASSRPLLGYVIGGLVFGCGGIALNLKLREIKAQHGREGRSPEAPGAGSDP